MDIKALSQRLQEYGVVGAGGAGFPTYAKLDNSIQIILLNCAECEPLLKLHRQLLKKHAYKILNALQMMVDSVGANEAIIGIKEEYQETVDELNQYLPEFPMIHLHLLDCIYPMGDEIVTIYETTGKVIKPGGLPIEQGVAVFNVETVYNIYRAVKENKPVTDKVVSVVAEVNHPVTVRVPIGCTIDEVVSLAGGAAVKNPAYFIGGPMMGKMGAGSLPVTKTTNAVLVLPPDHLIIHKANTNTSIDLKRAASACCNCQMCTDLCPRNALGYPIEPHKFMRMASNQDFHDTSAYLNTLYCSSCGVCEMYSCPQSLSPRSLITAYKDGLKKAGIRPLTETAAAKVKAAREYRKVPADRLEARLGLKKYNQSAPLKDAVVAVDKVKILLSQHIGIPAKPCVAVGDVVYTGQLIGASASGLSVGIHASIDGKVTAVTDSFIMIERSDRKDVG